MKNTKFRTAIFPKTRIATIDICEIGMQKHHVAAMIEVDVTNGRKKIKELASSGINISFTAWLAKVIGATIKNYEEVAAYIYGRRKIIIFNDINISIIVEKNLNGKKVPIPLVIDKANERSAESITKQIRNAQSKEFTEKDIVLHKKSNRLEGIYYMLPGFLRRFFWRYLLRYPRLAYNLMGNVALTSVGMMGNVSGWIFPTSVLPICFGISTIVKKPKVIDDKIEIREILNMTVLLDHDVVDGAPMARFINELCTNMENGFGL